jgi:hypothetical protein
MTFHFSRVKESKLSKDERIKRYRDVIHDGQNDLKLILDYAEFTLPALYSIETNGIYHPIYGVCVMFSGTPSQCGMIQCHHWNNTDKAILEMADAIGARLGYSKALATLVSEEKIGALVEHGWVVTNQFYNRRSGNNVTILLRDLPVDENVQQ